MKDKNGKVLQFPKTKKDGASTEATTETPTLPVGKANSYQGVALMGVLALAVVGNLAITQMRKQTEGRGLASVGSSELQKVWEANLVRKLASQPMRGLAAMGTQPQVVDELLLGDLQGHYSLEFESGKIKAIRLNDGSQQPVHLTSADKFLRKYRNLWTPMFESCKKKSTTKEGEAIVHIYELYDQSQVSGTVELRFDSQERFLEMRFQPLKSQN